MEFIHDDFLLHSEMARRLYHDYAADEPILDYHSHLPPADVASDHRFSDLWEIWLQGDHYKWRLMRANGVSEEYCTGARSRVREVSGLGPYGAVHTSQSSLSLDASRAEAILRHR